MKNISACVCIFIFLVRISSASHAQPLIINHQCTDITRVPPNWIDSAKVKLHIVYGHTSHGSQVTDGMGGLIVFANGGGKNLSLPQDFFAFNAGGPDGSLDYYDDYNIDAGYYPDWVDRTKMFLEDTISFPRVNVYMWSWCGQVDDKYSDGTLASEYLLPMEQLEQEYPGVRFVYMTGHLDHGDTNNRAANDSVRRFCERGGKILFDFADIESYNPDGLYFEFADDACNYYSSLLDDDSDGNWAEEWRNLHAEGQDWYDCGAAHSDPLNANQKAYAAWWMWARLAGWDGNTTDIKEQITVNPQFLKVAQNYPNPFNPVTTIEFTLQRRSPVLLKVYDILGNEVATLLNGEKEAGAVHKVRFDGSALASGIYFYRLTAGENVQVRKLVLVK